MTKKKTTKILALIVAIVMVAVTFVFSPSIFSFADDLLGGKQNEEQEENSAVSPSVPDEENPKTFDNIGTAILMITASIIGLAGMMILLKKEII